MNTTKLIALAASALSLAGLTACDTDSRMPYCEETVTVLSSLDELTPAGVSAGEILAHIEGGRLAQLDYVSPSANESVQIDVAPGGEGSTELYLELVAREGGQLRWIEAEEALPPGNGPVPAIAISCPNRLEIDAELVFETEDGAFAELFEVIVTAAVDEWGETGEAGTINLARITQAFDPGALAGALEVLSINPSDPERVDYNIDLSYPLIADEDGAVGVPSGSVSGGAEYHMGSGKDGVVMYGFFELARFAGLPLEEDGDEGPDSEPPSPGQ